MKQFHEVALAVLLAVMVGCSFAGPVLAEEGEAAPSDSIQQWKEKNLKQTPLEWTGHAVGDVVFFPFYVSFTVLKESIRIVDETKIVQKVSDWLEKDDGTRKLEPIISPSRGVGGRLILKRHGDDRQRLAIAASGLHEGRTLEEIELKDIPLAGRSLMLNLYGFYARLPEEPFYGFGPHSSEWMESDYGIESFGGEFGLGSEIRERVELEAFGGYNSSYTFILEEEDEEEDQDDAPYWRQVPLNALPGGQKTVEMSFLGGGFSIDRRNHPGISSAGCELEVTSSVFTEIGGDDYGFLKSYVDARQYIHLFHGRVLMMRLAGEFTDPLDNRSIPFYYLSEIGQTGTVRGFQRGRFRDYDAVYGTLEYRIPIRDVWQESGYDFHVFADGGQVATDVFRDFAWNNMQAGFGFGIRTWDLEGENLRVDVSFSRDGGRVYLVLNAL